ncbi:single-pass membrane and coiled-coil domain-containing protein 4-like [Agrilus planipennis]|uniref:Single-pass membrane and coiled-coil domain-containing protein 4 homolog n=1 Tax=Agrilus planipennis TaxID=224129 RepID=A0A1W4XE78_AGRPL|nr:single-pass membrane and coiled-coil domain-containing protein 4-like [Agrilus planipennis]XP_018330753.1 single-pass membrane and coiled-coil domain-containing protein 4-like [Agrilus planipennis]
MRQLKGKPKESSREKKLRKKEFQELKRKVFTIALPTIAAVFLFIVAYVYIKTRPKGYVD